MNCDGRVNLGRRALGPLWLSGWLVLEMPVAPFQHSIEKRYGVEEDDEDGVLGRHPRWWQSSLKVSPVGELKAELALSVAILRQGHGPPPQASLASEHGLARVDVSNRQRQRSSESAPSKLHASN